MTDEALVRMEHKLSLICEGHKSSCWKRGVSKYAEELMEDLIESRKHHEVVDINSLRKVIMRGAISWIKYSNGALGLVSSGEIIKRLGTKADTKKYKGGILPPKTGETWFEVEARALSQAFELIKQAFNYATKTGE